MTSPRVSRYGLDSVYVDLGLQDAPDRAARTHASARVLRNRFPEADVVVGGGVLVVVGAMGEDDVAAAFNQTMTELGTGFTPTNHVLPIVFDGPDLEDVSNASGLSAQEIVQSLVDTDFMVELVGFLPGFGYLGPLDPRLMLPRRYAPRTRVPAGSLGIAGGFAGVYPFASPGGWHLLGRAVGVTLFDPHRDKPFLFAPADHVRFEALAAGDVPTVEPFPATAARPIADKPAFVVEVAPACATIQDLGRLGRLHCGMPPSGPLDPDTFYAANLAVGNAPGEAALEIPLGRFAFRALTDLVISVDGDKCIRLANGERFEVSENARAVRYLALRGGIDVPLVLGSRSTLLVARVGGFSGRPLRKGDIVGLADRAVGEMPEDPVMDEEPADVVVIVIYPGPHTDRFPAHALDVLLSSTYSISTLGDRVGLRLDGEKIPRAGGGDSALPVPMTRGAMQIATDGTPIVFGPDHPATGGYPVLAIVQRSSWGILARLRAGRQVQFVLAE
jgi:KipI family sensor histidine kinase inhibitor